MNIFATDLDVEKCATEHVDKHTVKMILEYSQLMSTAHRVLDGKLDGKLWVLSNEEVNKKLYKATHINHPSAIWVRQSKSNYQWLYNLLVEVGKEYTYRYGKVHKVFREGLSDYLKASPENISNTDFTPILCAMPDEYKTDNFITSYRQYINYGKTHLHNWKNRKPPSWITLSH